MNSIIVLTREDLHARGWTARAIRKQKPDILLHVQHRGRPKFGHTLASVLAEAKKIIAESKAEKVPAPIQRLARAA